MRISFARSLSLWVAVGALLAYWSLSNPTIFWNDQGSAIPNWPFLLAALAFWGLGDWRATAPALSRFEGWVGIGLIGGGFFVTGPVQHPLLLLGASSSARAMHVPILRRLGAVAHSFSWLYLMQGILFQLAPFCLGRVHEIPGLAAPLALAGRLVGLDVQAVAGCLVFPSALDAVVVDVSAEKLAVLPVLVLWLAAGFVLWRLGAIKPAKNFAALTIALLLLAAFRYLALCALVSGGTGVGVFYRELPLILSLAAILLVLAGLTGSFVTGHETRTQYVPASNPEEGRVVVGLVGAVALCLALVMVAEGPGRGKEGRILVDELHSNWEKTDVALDLDRFGTEATYNYYSFFEFLRYYFPRVDRNYLPLCDETLSQYDILILKTPTEAYAGEEIDSIRRFLESGGGVWLIGDHTDVFGMNTYLGPVASLAGIRLRSDALVDQVEMEHQIYEPFHAPLHPSVRRMPPRMLMMTSSSLDVPWSADLAMVSHSTFSDRPDFSKVNFFGNFIQDPEEPFGMFPQAAVARVGRGRLSVFSDSTIFSSFGIFLPGKAELALGTLDWLNRTNASSVSFVWMRVLGFGCIAVGLCLAVRRRSLPSPSRLVAALGAVSGVPGGEALNGFSYPALQPRCPVPAILFDGTVSSHRLPIEHETHEWDTDNYHTFFVGTQRLGLVPRVHGSSEAPSKALAIVFISPKVAPGALALERLLEYVRGRGSLFPLDDGKGNPAAENSILEPLGLRLEEMPKENTELSLSTVPGIGRALLPFESSRRIQGGSSLLRTPCGRSVLAKSSFGKGTVVAAALGDVFSVHRFGDPESVPKGIQRDLWRLEAWLVKEVLNVRPIPPCGASSSVR